MTTMVNITAPLGRNMMDWWEKVSFINTLPLSLHQREFVKDCWKHQPNKNNKTPWLVRTLDYLLCYGLDIVLLLYLVVWPRPAVAATVLTILWLLSLLVIMVVLAHTFIIKYACGLLPGTSPTIPHVDNLLTSRWLMKKLIPAKSWMMPLWAAMSIIGLTALMMSRHWITAVMYAMSLVTTLLFTRFMLPLVKHYVVVRARTTYAEQHHLDPEIDPDQINPNHQRSVLD